ncbi:MAG: tryptophan-rich sensory protein [Clostridia bacterium]|nr:tryptophan-rich sensory protein [Clostridia bacterium]
MVFKFDLKRFLISIAIPLLVGGLSAVITSGNMNIYSSIVRPPLSPPSWIFPVVWSVLYVLMGVSLYLVWNTASRDNIKRRAFILFGIQLALNFIWSPIFFNQQQFLLAFVVLIILLLFTVLMILSFYKTSKKAALLQLPYLLWLTFAAYLNFAIYLLN